jgi:diguanylate cyclase (GGDEF)-like protein/PAS domain S-box-containing protein
VSTTCNRRNESISCAMREHCNVVTRWWELRANGGTPCFAGRTVLIAEGDPALAGSIQLLAGKEFRCHVWRAESRQEIERILVEEPVDVLVLDLRLAEPDPLDFIRKVRSRHGSVGILAIRSDGCGPSDADLFDARVADVLPQPCQQGELQAKLEQVLWERSMADGLAEAEFQYRKIFELNSEGMVIVDAETGAIETANKAFCELTNLDAAAVRSRGIAEYLAAGEAERFEAGLMLCGSRGQGTIGGISFIANGHQRLFDVSTTFYNTPSKRLACLSFKDISEKHDLELRLTEAAQKDALTELYNQRSFQTRIEGAVAAARHKGSALTLMLIDLDSFKACNDKHGHQTGDLVLQTVGRLIHQNVRGGQDEGFRCGGDEFAVVLRESNIDIATRIGRRLQESFGQASNYGTSMSIGLAQYEPSMNPKAFIQAADRTLYRAKLAGKSCIAVWDEHQGTAP